MLRLVTDWSGGYPQGRGERFLNSPHGAPRAGSFNGPHGLAADGDGNLYVAEWLIGGSMNKFARVASEP